MKILHCRDAGFDCEGVIRANSEEEVLNLAAKHAQEVHGVSVTPEMAKQLKMLIRDDQEE
jgi:predicted small metal-binding protein